MKRILIISIVICLPTMFIAGLPLSGYAEVIHGCIAKNGVLRIVTGPQDCAKFESPISWDSGYSNYYWKADAFSLEGYGSYFKCLFCNEGDVAIGGECLIAGTFDWALVQVGLGDELPPRSWCCGAGVFPGRPGRADENLDVKVNCATPVK